MFYIGKYLIEVDKNLFGEGYEVSIYLHHEKRYINLGEVHSKETAFDIAYKYIDEKGL